MPSFTIGEEVLYEGRRFVITTASADPPYRYRLVATTPEGARITWARADELRNIRSYTEPVDDTARI